MSERNLNKKHTTGSGFLGFDFLFKLLLNILPICLYFSYFPVIKLGASESMNFELSVPLIWLVLFDMVGAVLMWRKRLWKRSFRGEWPWLLLPVWLTLTVLWSLNFVRGVLTVGILWLVYLAGFEMWSLRGMLDEKWRRGFWKWFLIGTLVVCVWCVVQCVLDVAGVGREYTLMCAGCTYRMFGFPHPNGFAIEPQFMGNLLLAPTLIIAWLCMNKQSNKNQCPQNPASLESKLERSRGVFFTTAKSDSARYFSTGSSSVAVVKNTTGSRFLGLLSKLAGFWGRMFLPLCLFTTSATLFLTFSRGAIYAMGVGLLVVCIWAGVRQKSWRVLQVLGIVAVAFLGVLGVQGIMAEVSPTNDTFRSGVAKVVNHLSLGVIDVGGAESEKSQALESGGEDAVDNRGEVVEKPVENSREEAVFDGYVAESTDTRLRLTGAAVDVWRQDAATALFGVGLGGAGQALYVNGLSTAPKEIVQNEYTSLLLETGVVGVLLFVMTLVLVVRALWKSPARVGLIALVVAYGVSLCFFSGLPNALQIYLMPVVLCVALRGRATI